MAEESSEKSAKGKSKGGSSESSRDRNQRVREEAAAKRSKKREQERRAPARNLDASEIIDDAFARGTQQLGLWLKRHFNVIQYVVLLVIVGGVGYKIYDVQSAKKAAANTEMLLAGMEAEQGRVGEDPAAGERDRNSGLADMRKEFPTEDARLKAAADSYEKTASSAGGDVAVLAKMGEAGVLFDQQKFKEALSRYESVRDSALATQDQDVKGRAIEGVGLSREGLEDLDGALKSYRELENSGISGFTALGLYHQARIHRQKGETDKAKELLEKALKRLGEQEKSRAPGSTPGYLYLAARELLAAIDPAAAQALPSPNDPSSKLDPQTLEKLKKGAGSSGISREKLAELMKQLSKPGPTPPPNEGAPEAPEAPDNPEQAPDSPQAPAPPASAP